MLARIEMERQERELLASYAMRSEESRGRTHPEEEHDYRSIFQRDRDRIIHSTAFRRLEYKTQVFVNHEGDYYRTRLTHTVEVAQIARSIARNLRLNEDLTEAIALAHDLGHTPFGHSGEEALRELMEDEGGFEHNRQGLRVVEQLERRNPHFPGLNLSWEVREGIIKHTTSYDRPFPSEFEADKLPTLEAQIVNLADEIAYNNHDLDDGLMAEMISEEALEKVSLWDEIYREIRKKFPHSDRERRKYQTIRALINLQVTDLITETEKRLEQAQVGSVGEVRETSSCLVSFSPRMIRKNEELKQFLLGHLYHHYRVVRMTGKAHRFIRELFKTYLDHPRQLPPNTQEKFKEDLPARVICDYIAGMTDRFALDEYSKLFQPYGRV
ncbi:deoxyguanosinetriphosphate triphosphohydrolase [candidate division NPL-UPA2 bacterium]|nr:deoxyguanosinetriphosphate triphosphohydrolase [candidate division NPL-UPA2 bacterium]